MECEEKRASSSGSADIPDAPSVRLDNRFRDKEPEPEPGHIGTVELPIALEDPLELVLSNSRSEISDRELNTMVDCSQAPEDFHFRGAELEGVGKEVREDLKDP